MASATYIARRDELELYFDRTAVDAWMRLTSDAPVGRIRATVRAGREAMRDTLLTWLPNDLRGARVLDAGCGTGAMAVSLARRGADVSAIDISPSLIELARDRAPRDLGRGSATFVVGDMLDPQLGQFDYVVAMDSLVHYDGSDIARTIASLAARTRSSIVFTIAPRTFALSVMHAAGRLFPRGHRAPAILPISRRAIERRLASESGIENWRIGRSGRVDSGFYISQALEVIRA
jgi:magnesium-protoporphyrin O-methyltransferase